MKINIDQPLRENQRSLLRRCGYFEQHNRNTGEASYIRQLRRTPYPRFHIYINHFSAKGMVLNLHLDAKKPVYAGTTAHAGEYDSEIVTQEAERIKLIIR
ncbi:hypothetical protein KKG41_02420 [Patescibacteria group bacterium]|nr:hypothetical protein [Patescibacteria group bacterium]MBU1889884.1 hypothetical protein [Patescibacteria group bacterium]